VGALHEGARLLLLADVGGDRDRAAALPLDPLGEGLDAVQAPGAQRDGCGGVS